MKTILSIFIALIIQFNLNAQNVSTFAGSGIVGNADGNGSAASFNFPQGICIDAVGNIFVADTTNSTIRKITPTGTVSTIAGTVGVSGSWEGQGTAAAFNGPIAIAVDAAGNLYVADLFNHKIRKISPTGLVSTFSGAGGTGNIDGIATVAKFGSPTGIAIDSNGNLFVTERANHKVRKVFPDGSAITFAGNGTSGSTDGNGTSAQFYQPSGITIDGNDNVYVVENFGQRIRKITPTGDVTTIAGNGTAGFVNGTGTAASFNYPSGIVADNTGNLYVVDTNNSVIRKINSAGEVTTFAGTGAQGNTNGGINVATFKYPKGIAQDSSGNFYITDNYNHNIRKITMQSLGANEIDEKQMFKIYPNPFTDEVNISIENSEKAELEILDMNGRLVSKKSLNEKKNVVNTTGLNAGMYLFKINHSGKISTVKGIKK